MAIGRRFLDADKRLFFLLAIDASPAAPTKDIQSRAPAVPRPVWRDLLNAMPSPIS
jgi:hypothetical protein